MHDWADRTEHRLSCSVVAETPTQPNCTNHVDPLPTFNPFLSPPSLSPSHHTLAGGVGVNVCLFSCSSESCEWMLLIVNSTRKMSPLSSRSNTTAVTTMCVVSWSLVPRLWVWRRRTRPCGDHWHWSSADRRHHRSLLPLWSFRWRLTWQPITWPDDADKNKQRRQVHN